MSAATYDWGHCHVGHSPLPDSLSSCVTIDPGNISFLAPLSSHFINNKYISLWTRAHPFPLPMSLLFSSMLALCPSRLSVSLFCSTWSLWHRIVLCIPLFISFITNKVLFSNLCVDHGEKGWVTLTVSCESVPNCTC